MPEESFQERTEQATSRRRQDARKKGQVARSMELNSFAVLFIGVITLFFVGPQITHQLADLMRGVLQESTSFDLSAGNVPRLFLTYGGRMLIILTPVLVAVMVTGLLINFAQVGFFVAAEPLTPKLDRLDLVKGLKRLFNLRSAVELLRNILKLVIIGWIAYGAIKAESKYFIALMDSDVHQLLSFTGKAAFHIVLKITLGLLVLSILDYAYQKWDFEKSIRMSRQEIKEEVKQYEGSPVTRSRVRRVQMELSRMRQTREVPKADVVVTNPTYLAVALKYDPENMGAPTVVSKGARLFAEKIKKIAREHNVPIVQNPPLARALYQAVEVGAEVPGHLYKAVAEVLAFVYRLKNREAVTE